MTYRKARAAAAWYEKIDLYTNDSFETFTKYRTYFFKLQRFLII